MSGIDNAGEGITNQKQFIEYTAFNKVSRITQGINELNINRAYDIFYGLDEQRIKTVYDDFSISGHIKTRYYFGSYEKDIDEFGNVTETDYLYTPVGLTAMQRKTSAGANLYYIHTDLLGSIQAISNASGVRQAEYAYTPWGGRITLTSPPAGDLGGFDRGYTGHEHLSPFGDDSNGGFCLINMNGRIYDPVLARFLSPDPYVQAPDYTQSFNRYAYCWNNPFRYTDPSGELIITSILIGAAIGGTINLISQIASGNVRNGWDALGAFGIGADVGGLSDGAGAWAAGAVKAVGVFAGAGIGALTGSVTGGASSFLLNGGNNLLNGNGFLDNWQQSVTGGMISGAIGGAIGGGIQGWQNADKLGANHWTGYKEIGAERVYSTQVKVSTPQPDPTKECYAYSIEYSDKGHGNISAQQVLAANSNKAGEDIAIAAQNAGLKNINAARSLTSQEWEQLGKQLQRGKIEMSAIIPQAGMERGTGHAVNITTIRVVDKLRLFGGGTTTILKGTTIWNPIGGVTQNQNSFLKIIWIKY